MDASSRLGSFLEPLPPALAEQLADYADYVLDSLDAICERAHVSPSLVDLNDLAVLAALRRLWSYLESQRWLLTNSLAGLKTLDSEVSGFTVGDTVFTPSSRPAMEIADLESQLRDLLARHNIEFLVTKASLTELISTLAADR